MKIKIRRKNKIKFSFILYIFFFIYAPPIVPKINFIFIQFFYSFFMLFYFYKKNVIYILKKYRILKYIKKMLLAYLYIIFLIIIFSFIDFVGFDNYIKTIYRFILLIPITITCITYIVVLAEKYNYSQNQIIEAIIYAGFIEGIITMLMFLFPSIRNFFISVMYNNTNNELLNNLWYLQRRCYAFANTIVDSFGYGSGIIAGICFYYAMFQKKFMFIFLPVLIAVPLLNARTGLVVFAIFVIFTFFYILKSFKLRKLLSIIFIAIVVIVALPIIVSFLSKYNSTMVTWLDDGIQEIFSLFFENDSTSSGSVSVLFDSKWWYLPEFPRLIVGTGHNVYLANGYVHSDVGYVNDLWLGGIIGCYLLYSPLLKLVKESIENKSNHFRNIVPHSLLFSFLVTNIKGYMINYNPGMAVTLLLLFVLQVNKKTIIKNNVTKT